MIHDPVLEAQAAILVQALPYIQKFRGQTFVIKYGGSAMDDPHQVDRLLRDIVFLEAVGINPVVVHGGGKAITQKMKDAGLQAHFVNGLRVTDESTISLVREALDDEINPHIVETIGRFGGRAAGLSGRDVFIARPLDPQPDETGKPVDIGYVGEAASVDIREVLDFVAKEIVPVISPIGAAEDGTLLNINADVAAAALAAGIRAHKLIFVSDVRGIMRDPLDPSSLLPSVAVADVPGLIQEHILRGGMIPKVQSAVSALRRGVEKVHLICGAIPHCLLLEIFTDGGIGTEILEVNVH
jgi:acetylglutamate kinase